MKKIWYSFRFLIIMIAAFAVARCNQKTEAKTATAVSDNAIAVKLQPVTDTSFAPVLRYSGTIASTTEATLSFKTGGIISRIYVKEGDHVVKGQVLATLDLTEINAQVQQAAQECREGTAGCNQSKEFVQ